MADYIEPLDPNVPADSDLISDGDDAIRQKTRAWIERLSTVFGDLNINPLKFSAGVVPGTAIADQSLVASKFDPALNLKSILMTTVEVSEIVAAGAIGGGAKTVAGAEPGDFAVASWHDGRFAVMAAVTGVDEVTVAYANVTAGSITLTDAQLQIAVIKAGTLGALHGETKKFLSFTAFRVQDPTMDTHLTVEQLMTNNTDAIVVYASVVLLPGEQITGASLKVRSDDIATVTGDLFKVNAGVPTSLASFAAVPGDGVQQLDETFDYTVVAGDIFTFVITLSSAGSSSDLDAGLYWAEILLA